MFKENCESTDFYKWFDQCFIIYDIFRNDHFQNDVILVWNIQ